MRELKDPIAIKYLIERTGLEGQDLDVVGDAACLTAYYGDMLNFEQLAIFAGMSKGHFRKKLRNALDTIYFVTRRLEIANDAYLWEVKPHISDFTYAMAAGIISEGFYPETQAESEVRRFVREWLNHFFLPGSIRSAAAFRGYLATLEYLTSYLCGITDLTLTAWLRYRYGDHCSQVKDIKVFLRLSWEYRAVLDGVASLFEGELSGECPKTGAFLKRVAMALSSDWEITQRDGKAF